MANCSKESAKPSPIIHLKSDHVVKTTQKLYLDEETADCYFVFDIDDGKKTENSWRRFLNAYFQTSIFEKWNRTKITQRVPAHKILLATGSEVFKPMFYGGWLEKSEVKIIDVSIEAFTEFLQFFYSNDITISIENVAELMFLAEKYFVDDCLKLCDTVIYEHLPIDDIVSGYELAIKFDRIDLQEKLVAKIGEQAKNVLQSDSFLQCSRIMLKRILEINSLSSVPEDVFDACMIWSKISCEKNGIDPLLTKNRKKQFGDCFHLIPFYAMNREQISNCTTIYDDLFDRDEMLDLINIMAASGSGVTTLIAFRNENGFLPAHSSNKLVDWEQPTRKKDDRMIWPEAMTVLSHLPLQRLMTICFQFCLLVIAFNLMVKTYNL